MPFLSCPETLQVLFVPTQAKTPALRAGTVDSANPYKFALPPQMVEQKVANIASGNYCQPRCDEPWTGACVLKQQLLGRCGYGHTQGTSRLSGRCTSCAQLSTLLRHTASDGSGTARHRVLAPTGVAVPES